MLTFWTIFSALIILIVVIAVITGVFLWIRRRKYTRERFAFVSLAAIVAMTTMLIVAFSKNMMPWDAAALLLNHFFGINVPLSKPTPIDYSFLLLVYYIGTRCIIQLHTAWPGLKSVEQHRREQRSEAVSVFVEGLIEAKRFATRQPAPIPYTPPDPLESLTKLEPVTDSLAWKDQARELIRLSSPSYAFDADTGWLDLSGVWIGTNLDTNEAIFLHPASTPPTDVDVDTLLARVQDLAHARNAQVDLLLIAIRGDEPIVAQPPRQNVRLVTESELLDNLVNWSDYHNEIRKRVMVNHLPDSNLTLQDVYVPPKCATENGDGLPQDVQTLLTDWASEQSRRHIALLGGYGQGKSTTTLLFSHQLLSNRQQGSRIPLLIELRGTSPRNLTPLQLLGAWSSQFNLNPQALLRLHIAGRLILIFEGFDEMALVGDAEMRLKHFRTLWQFSYPKAKIIITGRPNFFLDEHEMKSALGIHKPNSENPYCQALRLLPFNKEQIIASLRSHKGKVREQISSLVEINPRFRELVSRPSLLHIVSVLWDREELSTKIDELDSAYIMELFVRHSYRRQGRKELDSPEFMALTGAEREYFMQGIATYMASNGLPNQISGSQLSELVELLIMAAPESLSSEGSAMSGEVRYPLKKRLEGSEHGVEHVKTDVRACGLLVDDPAAPGTFRFGHKSFMEFLFAAVLADCINSNQERSRAILKATNAGITDLIGLPVSADFLAEMLASSHADGANERGCRRGSRSAEWNAAQRLLDAVLGGPTVMIYVKRVCVFCDAVSRSIGARFVRGNSAESKAAMMRLVSFSVFSMVPMVVMMVLLLGQLRGQKLDVDRSLYFLLCFPGVVMIVQHTARSMRVWNMICKNMGIPDDVMHRVVGTWYLPWTRKQPFDYFLGVSSLRAQRRERSHQS